MKILCLVLSLFICLASSAYGQQQVSPTHSAVNVTTSTTAVVSAAVFFRQILILVNDSDAVIYCNLAGAAAVLNQGIRLNANGGNIVMDVAVTKTAVNCIHGNSGNKVILVTEG